MHCPTQLSASTTIHHETLNHANIDLMLIDNYYHTQHLQ